MQLPACSKSCANRCNSRPRPPTCSRSSAARPSICRPCSTRSSNLRHGFVATDKANRSRVKDDRFEVIAFSGFQREYREYMKALSMNEVDRGSITGKTVLEGRTVHIPDVLADREFTWFEAQKRGGFAQGLAFRSCARELR